MGNLENYDDYSPPEESKEDYDYNSDVLSGEITENPNSIDRIFNTENLLYAIKKTLLGWEYSENEWKPPRGGTNPVATTETINKIVNSMRSIIHTSGILADKDQDEINFDMLEINKMVISNVYDDIMVEEQDVEYIVNLVDHTIGMFMSIIKDGAGAENARQILSGNYMQLTNKNNYSDPAFRVGTSDRDLFTIWGKRK